MFASVVWPNGTLNPVAIYKREEIYQGMNGRNVERFYMSPSESYIFKPLTNQSQIGNEIWIHQHFLSKLPSIYPKIMAYSINENTENNWIVFEDLGRIRHQCNEEIAFAVIDLMAVWHAVPAENLLNDSFKGPKPFIEEIIEHLFIHKESVTNFTTQNDIPAKLVETIFTMLENYTFSNNKVISHGDLHQGNYGLAGDRLVIIDWEHVHLNSPYWDLYHFLDISHPDFPKKMNKEMRELILEYYLNKVNFQGDRRCFKQMYYLFSAAFSCWMLLLIQADLGKKETKWPKEGLLRQKLETVSNLIQCGEMLERNKQQLFISEKEVFL